MKKKLSNLANFVIYHWVKQCTHKTTIVQLNKDGMSLSLLLAKKEILLFDTLSSIFSNINHKTRRGIGALFLCLKIYTDNEIFSSLTF